MAIWGGDEVVALPPAGRVCHGRVAAGRSRLRFDAAPLSPRSDKVAADAAGDFGYHPRNIVWISQ